ncbi:uncharacterized protein LOC110452596 isoform X2 [Mizuhopecten yessoensis]|uniref:uncharacterized protein LOC110452596 isoform X2 n=1 Tax=Mizuhopecten yessoensis TaxID=6573 RepID=UPI000B45B899|nr:uncharacterized protein LOC110452596 isoform X2 [Mizuhopecten yessoensis]
MATEEQPEAPVLLKTDFVFDEVPIGRGGFGTVYRAKHKDFGIVAVKTLIDNGLLPQKHIRILIKEAKKLSQVCGHTSILKLLGTIMEKDNYSLILEYMALGSLVDFRKEFKVQWPVVGRILMDIVSGMEFLHTHDPQILHLDLKGDNILLNGQIRAKIADFGLSEWRTITMTVTRGADATSGSNPSGRRCTVTHVPPEVWSNVNAPSSTLFDIYSFGIVLWELLSGGVPYRGASDDLVRSAVLSGQRPDFSVIPKDCSPKFTQLMTRCWHQKAGQRPPFTVIKKEVDSIYSNQYEKDIVKALKNIRAEIVEEYERDDPVYTQTADIDNMQVPTFTVPKIPVATNRDEPVRAATETPSTSRQPSPGASSNSETVTMETVEEDDDTPVDVKLFKVEDNLDPKERMMRKIIHNPIAMRLVHSPYAKEIFRISDDVVNDLRNPKKVERLIQSDLALQWELKFAKFDVQRELSGRHSKLLQLNNEVYNEIHKEALCKDRGRTHRKTNYGYREYLTEGQRKRDRRRARVEETMNKNPNVGGYNSGGNYFRLKRALDNPSQLRQAMKDKENGTTGSSLVTIDNEIFDLMKDPYLLIGVLYQEHELLYKLSENYPDMFLKMLQGLNGYSSYTSCYSENQSRNRMRMLEMMRFRDMRGPEDLMMMMEMAGPKMRKNMRRHPMHDMDDDDEDMHMMMMRDMAMMNDMKPHHMDEMRKKMRYPMHRMEMERMKRHEEMGKFSKKDSKSKSISDFPPGGASKSGGMARSSSSEEGSKTKLDSDGLDEDGPKSNSLETDAAPPMGRVEGTADILPWAIAQPAVRQSTTPVHARPQTSSSVTKPSSPSSSSNVATATATSTPAATTSVSSAGNNVASLGSALTASAGSAEIHNPMEVDPFPSLLTLKDSTAGHGLSQMSETSLKQVYKPPSPGAASSASKVNPTPKESSQSTKVSTPEASGSRRATETQSLDQNVSIDANPSLESVFTEPSKTTYSTTNTGKTHTILHERPGCSTKITFSAEQGANSPNIQVGDENVMVVNSGSGRVKVPSEKSAAKQVPANLTKSTRKATLDDFEIVAENIGTNTRQLSRGLNIKLPIMDQIEIDFRSEGTYEVCFQMLKRWVTIAHRGATVAKLAQELSKIGRNDIANQLQ